MSELVLMHHNEPMTTSLAIAEGTENTHEAIIKMVRKYVESLQEFGRVGFEIEPFATAGGIQTREVAFLNEPQATLLITFLRNSEIVVRFKVALVKAFFELRDRLNGQQSQRQFLTGDPSHGADLAVAADRTFRSFLRAGRSAGLPLSSALRAANRKTLERTGMDILAELEVDPDNQSEKSPSKETDDPLYVALVEWLAGAGDGPLRLAEILRGAVGIGPEHGYYPRLTGAVSSYLRKLGWTMRHERIDGGKPTRYWRRIGAPLVRF